MDHAVVDPAKIRDFLLSRSHPVGRHKAAFFAAPGYTTVDWERLRHDLIALARGGTVTFSEDGPFGRKLALDGMLSGPSGRSASVRTIWIAETDSAALRFVTAYPR